ncbi:membrane protein [Ligilactobacillus pabuli]|uniref:Membrane protein n=1 Tax=Ligilactobacillus pabuli TaxID=2886039 RepID=A0ABQ5JJX3_9LACO|nr:DUF1146 family protein [Ligilactobacillus pabuli]GKS82401.1 membrane protein [Ligilactobacillus pabuli]HIW89627.1 DUF1146 family protein [Candidatus Ligilactobacillus excrementipullorum]
MKWLGFSAILTIVSHFIFIALAFTALQSLRLDHYIVPERQGKFKLVLVLLSVAVGFLCSQFFLSFVDNLRNLSYLFVK